MTKGQGQVTLAGLYFFHGNLKEDRQNEICYQVHLSTLSCRRHTTFHGAFLLRLSVHCATHDTRLTHSHRKLRQAEDFEMLRLKPDFETLCLTCDFKTLRQTPVRRPPDATFRNQASGARFLNHAPDVIFCDHASDVQYESGYVAIQIFLTHIFIFSHCRLREILQTIRNIKKKFSQQYLLHILLLCLFLGTISNYIVSTMNPGPDPSWLDKNTPLVQMVGDIRSILYSYNPIWGNKGILALWCLVITTTGIIITVIIFPMIYFCCTSMLCRDRVISKESKRRFAKWLHGVLLIMSYPCFALFLICALHQCFNPTILPFGAMYDVDMGGYIVDGNKLSEVIQNRFQCCGYHNAGDWEGHIPDSCCSNPPCTLENSYKQGCIPFLQSIANSVSRFSTIHIQYVCLLSLITVPFLAMHSLRIACFGVPQYKTPSGIQQDEEGDVGSHDTEDNHSLGEPRSHDMNRGHSLAEFQDENEVLQDYRIEGSNNNNELDSSSIDTEMLDAILNGDSDENMDNGDTQLLIVD